MSVMVLDIEELAEIFEGLNVLFPKAEKRNFEMVTNWHRMNLKTYAYRYNEAVGEVYPFNIKDLKAYSKAGKVDTERFEYQLSGMSYNIYEEPLEFAEKLELMILNAIHKKVTPQPLPFPTDAVRII